MAPTRVMDANIRNPQGVRRHVEPNLCDLRDSIVGIDRPLPILNVDVRPH